MILAVALQCAVNVVLSASCFNSTLGSRFYVLCSRFCLLLQGVFTSLFHSLDLVLASVKLSTQSSSPALQFAFEKW